MRFIRKISPGSGDRPIIGNGIGLSTASLLCAALVAGAMLFSSACSEKKEEAKHFESLIIAELRSDLGYDLKLTEPLPPAAEQGTGTAGSVEGKVVAPGKTPPGDTSTPLDPEYRAMQRFEVPADKHLSLNIQAPTPEEEETITTRDKKLVFGGKGFETQEFESHSKEKMNINYHTYVYSPLDEPIIFKRKPDHLDLTENRLRDSRPVIFHPQSANFNRKNVEVETVAQVEDILAKQEKIVLEFVPETKVLLKDTPKGMIRLRKTQEPMDLLIGNEAVNENRFQRWDRSTPRQ